MGVMAVNPAAAAVASILRRIFCRSYSWVSSSIDDDDAAYLVVAVVPILIAVQRPACFSY